MRVTVLPHHGGIHVDPNHPDHILRVAAHPDAGIVVVSIWRGDYCVVTHEVPMADVPDVIATLAQTLVPTEPHVRASAS